MKAMKNLLVKLVKGEQGGEGAAGGGLGCGALSAGACFSRREAAHWVPPAQRKPKESLL